MKTLNELKGEIRDLESRYRELKQIRDAIELLQNTAKDTPVHVQIAGVTVQFTPNQGVLVLIDHQRKLFATAQGICANLGIEIDNA